MSIKNKFEKWFYLDDEEDEVQEQADAGKNSVLCRNNHAAEHQSGSKLAGEPQQSATVVSLQSVQKSSKVILIEPRVYAEAQDISEHLKNKRAVVVNLQRIERDQGIRIVDFLSGTVYAIGGDIQRIGTDIFLCVPENVEVAGAISDYFER